eukprot:scaffold9678_cov83-Skeletonema_marinoi.AAC.1
MVKEWGMSKKVGLVALSTPQEGGPFMGRSMGQRGTQWGSKIMGNVDSEVERLVNNAYIKAKTVLSDNIELLHHLASTLVDQEVVTAEEFQIMVLMFNATVVDYKTFASNYDESNRVRLPFQKFPEYRIGIGLCRQDHMRSIKRAAKKLLGKMITVSLQAGGGCIGHLRFVSS